ncbi:hypothetical protein ABC795_14015 [Blastococcus sp. HT6-30]|uniref:hypothetical protein n=1 Tax=Blastococcus sp. HT6-30 TaxID=3144843 RepID=UPI00321B7205
MAGDVAVSRFVGAPQPVEIHHGGIWYSGELLGWRHTDGGRVSARVRCTIDGLRHSTWKDLTDLRLPDPAHPPRREPFPAPPARPTVAGETVPEEDRTRPHTLLAAHTSRPRPPAHAVAPPPAAELRPLPAAHAHPAAAPARLRPTPYRRTPRQADECSRDRTDARAAGRG